MTNDSGITLDLNNPAFQDALFALPKEERLAALDTLRKIKQISWTQLYADKGLRWEKIHSIKASPDMRAIYSLRLSRSCRATAFREGGILRFLSVYADHDAAYGKK